jgi:hypothetical protein
MMRIKSGDLAVGLKALSQDTSKTVSVKLR